MIAEAAITGAISLPLGIVAGALTVLAGAIGALWRQLILERREHQAAQQAEREKQDKLEAEFREQLKAEMRQRLLQQRLFLRSLGAQPLSSLPPEAEIP